MEKRLSELKLGESGTIIAVLAGPSHIKLLEMGCVEGAPIKVIHKALFAGPIAVQVSGYTLALRVSEADTIIVA